MKLPLKPVTMKGGLLALLFIVVACMFADAQRSCVSQHYLQQQVAANPLLQKSITAAEAILHTPRHHDAIALEGGPVETPVIRIPVVVHVLYYSAAQNISDEQVLSQVAVLNRDFRKLNPDTANIPAAFRSLAADCHIEFSLATVDPTGRPTRGIIRRKTNIEYFNIDDRIKSTAIGGDDAWDANSYLNIWTGNLVGGLVGYASPIGFPKDKDGVVIHYTAFGAMGPARAPYDKGRTATHEVGHWLGLKHIWGDRYCGDDNVDDTPPQQTSSYGCPTGTVITCNNAPFGNMYMNYMDLSYDACINLFTIGQRFRMRSVFNEGAARHALLFSKGCSGNPLPAPAALPGDSVHVSLTIYPNPVQRTLHIGLGGDEQLQGGLIVIFDQLGKQVLQVRITKSVTAIPVHHLKEGLYYLRVGGKVYKVLKAGE